MRSAFTLYSTWESAFEQNATCLEARYYVRKCFSKPNTAWESAFTPNTTQDSAFIGAGGGVWGGFAPQDSQEGWEGVGTPISLETSWGFITKLLGYLLCAIYLFTISRIGSIKRFVRLGALNLSRAGKTNPLSGWQYLAIVGFAGFHFSILFSYCFGHAVLLQIRII